MVVNLLFWEQFASFYEDLKYSGKPVILENKSSRMQIEFKDKQSAEKIKDAILTVFAKRGGVTKSEIAEKEIPVSFLELDVNCRRKDEKTNSKISLRKPVKIVVWDRSCGFGSGNATRVQFGVKNGQLSVMVYWVDNPSKTAVASGLMEGLEILYNNGEVNYSKESLILEAENTLVHKQPDGSYEPEIITIAK